jgi:uncharacterized membrane protein
MLFLPISLALFLLFLILIPLLFVLAPAVAFEKLGLDPFMGYAFFFLCLLGGGINLPVYRQKVTHPMPLDDMAMLLYRYFGVKIPVVDERVIAVNLGGAVLPGTLSFYLLKFVPFAEAAAATAVTATAAYLLSRPVKGVGIVMPPFVPPIIAAVTAFLVSKAHAPQLAYLSGVMGTLIGADLLRLPQIKRMEAPFLSIGGAGVFDGIYLVGLVSVLLA